jgi:hypothetical protein
MTMKHWTMGIAIYALTTAVAAANPVLNGNFESGDLSEGATPTDWIVTLNDMNNPADIGVYTGYDYQPCCGASGSPATLANHFVSFGPGNVDNSGYLEQTVTLAAGRYVLTYDVGAFGGGTQSLTAEVNGSTATVTATADNDTDTQFSAYHLDFLSTGAPVTLMFNAASGGVGDNIDVILDNVSVAPVVPEPSTWAMMAIGFVGLGLAARHAARKRAVLAG